MKYLIFFLLFISVLSCKETEEARIVRLVREWDGKEIIYPSKAVFAVLGTDTVTFAGQYEHAVVVYVDSTGCLSCKLQLPEWGKLIAEFDSLSHQKVPFLFYFHSKEKSSLLKLLKRVHFNYPVCIYEDCFSG